MNKYLLDTNICIFAFRDQYGINERMLLCGEDSMVTDNLKHFDRIEGIEVQNWVER